MESLAPTYKFCLDWRLALERGESTLTHLSSNLTQLPLDLQLQIRGAMKTEGIAFPMSRHRRALLDLIPYAVKGESVLPRLRELEKEILHECEHEMEAHLSRLSLRLMMPMMLLQFPAFLILLLGPLVDQLTEGLK